MKRMVCTMMKTSSSPKCLVHLTLIFCLHFTSWLFKPTFLLLQRQKHLLLIFLFRLIAKEMIAYHSVQPDGSKTTTDFFDKVSSFLEMSPDRLEDPAMQARLLFCLPGSHAYFPMLSLLCYISLHYSSRLFVFVISVINFIFSSSNVKCHMYMCLFHADVICDKCKCILLCFIC